MPAHISGIEEPVVEAEATVEVPEVEGCCGWLCWSCHNFDSSKLLQIPLICSAFCCLGQGRAAGGATISGDIKRIGMFLGRTVLELSSKILMCLHDDSFPSNTFSTVQLDQTSLAYAVLISPDLHAGGAHLHSRRDLEDSQARQTVRYSLLVRIKSTMVNYQRYVEIRKFQPIKKIFLDVIATIFRRASAQPHQRRQIPGIDGQHKRSVL